MDDSDDDFDYEQFLLAEQVRKYYYQGLYPLGIMVIWSLLRAGCYNISGCDSLGNPPIVYASKCGSVGLLRLLLYYKADINAVSKHRETALIVACRNKRMRVIKLLLKRGAQTDLLDRTGYSALRWAVIHEHVEMLKLLLRYNVSVTKDCYTSGSALDIAQQGTSEQHTIILKELEKKLGTEREALLVDVIEQKQNVIAEVDEYQYRIKREAEKEAEKAAFAEAKAASAAELTAQTTSKPTKRSRRKSSQKIVAGSRNLSLETSVGTRIATPPVKQATWQILEDDDDHSEWVKVATGKWQTRKQLQEPRTPITTAKVETFIAPDKETVCKLLTSDDKWNTLLAQQMPHKVTIVDLEHISAFAHNKPYPSPPTVPSPMLSMVNNNDGGPRVIRLPPYKYVHVLDTNSNVSRVLAGPLTYTRQEHEHVMTPPQNMIVLPAQNYVEVRNPVVRSEDGKIVRDAFDQAKLKHGEIEFRIFDKYPEPFPLYPGEEQVGEIRELRVVPVDTALRIRATRKLGKYVAGDEWLFVGPATYYPRVEEEIVTVVHAIVVKKNQAIKFRAEKKCTDSQDIERDAGEEWLVRTPGAYLPQIDEVHVETLQAHVLTQDTALHLRALRTFKDVYGISRRAGEEWLITTETAETHVQDVHEDIIGYVNVTILTNRQYCIVVDPVVNGVQHRGTRELRKGEASFFLQPGEQLENVRVENIIVLADDEAVLLQAAEPFVELPDQEGHEPEGEDGGDSPIKKISSSVRREAGERWMVHGPREYIPQIQVKVLETRRAIPLDVNEGVYVRERKTGHVRAVKGETYMLEATEELWSKYLPPAVEELLSSQAAGSAYVTDPTQSNKLTASLGRPWDNSKGAPRTRDPTRVVTFEVPHNAGIQVYDYKTTSSRILFGPTLVMLEPDEQFTVLRLSGGVPKEPNVIRTLCLQLGPDFMRDQIIVETSDHARLSLTIAYNWRFRVDSTKPADAAKVFNVKDFTGDACKTLASRIRGAVAVQNFDHFHKHSAQIIRTSIFGLDENDKLRDELIFPANNLCITNVDIQSAEPVDQLTRESLQKSVQLAIEITTKSQEARAKAIAMKEEEAAKGELLTQQLENQSSAEQARKNLVQLTAECKAVEEEAAAVSRARAQAQAAEIEGQAAVRQAELRAKAERIEHEAHVARIKEDQTLSVAHAERLAEVEVHKKRELMAIEAEKFQQMVSSVGQDTLVALARAGPDGQVKMLEALGLSGYLITDGKSPVNLLGTAEGIIRGISQAEQ